MDNSKIAVIICNLGGPDSLDSVRGFLKNLFSDPAILPVPNVLRWFLSRFISYRRTSVAKDIYKQINGKSPILEETSNQKNALLNLLDNNKFSLFIAMRYWHPFTKEALIEVEKIKPTRILMIPLYPQFSTTTTGSSITELKKISQQLNLTVPTNILCCYPFEQKFIAAHVELIKNTLKQLSSNNFRIIFSAHGLPQSIINKGDPYEWQINTTVEHIIKYGNFDSKKCRISYQSKVTPVKWLEPNTEDEIKIAGNDNLSVVIVPIAFVSEHSETLVELDIEYRDIAREFGVKEYLRVPTLSCNSLFMESLHSMIIKIANTPLTSDITSSSGMRICPVKFTGCPNTTLEL